MVIGYARVNPLGESLEPQLNALNKYACEVIFQERVSYKEKIHPQYEKMIDHLRKGDVVVVCKFSRIGRSLSHFVKLITSFEDKGVNFVSLQEKIDTRTEHGPLFFKTCSAFTEHEKEAIKERSMIGLEAARSKGRLGGRPKGLSKEAMAKANSAKILYANGDMTVQEIAKNLGISRATCYRYLQLE